MNLLEHCIQEVHSVEDVTNKFEERNGYELKEPFYKVELTCGCYGIIKRETHYFYMSEWREARKKGYFMA